MTAALILAAASLLRLIGLTYQSYWNDELISAAISDPANNLMQVIAVRLAEGTHPPLFNIALWAWYSIVGYSELSGRLLSALAGIAGVAAMMVLGWRLFSERVALLAGALTAVNYGLVYYSQEVRSYSLHLFLIPLGFLFFISTLRRFTLARGTMYSTVMVLALSMHYFAVFSLIAQGVGLLLLRSKRPPGYRLTSLLWMGLIILLVVVGAVLHQVVFRTVAEPMEWMSTFDPAFPGGALVMLIQSRYLAIVLASLAVLGAWRALSSGELRVTGIVLVVWLVGDITCLYIVGMIMDRGMAPHYIVGALPPMILLAGFGLDSLTRLRLTGIAAIVTASLLILGGYYNTPTKQDFRAALLFVDSQHGCVTAPAYLPLLLSAYSKLLDLSISISDNKLTAGIRNEFRMMPVLSCEDASGVWVIEDGHYTMKPDLLEDLSEVEARSYHGGVTVSRFVQHD